MCNSCKKVKVPRSQNRPRTRPVRRQTKKKMCFGHRNTLLVSMFKIKNLKTISHKSSTMGAASSSTKAKVAVVSNESGGLHLLEFHVPSASMGLGLVFIVGVIAILACLIATRIRRWFRRRPSQNQSHAWGLPGPSRPHAAPQHSVVYYSPGHPYAGVSLDRQMLRGQNPPPLAFDEDRFATAFPGSTLPTAPETTTSAPEANAPPTSTTTDSYARL